MIHAQENSIVYFHINKKVEKFKLDSSKNSLSNIKNNYSKQLLLKGYTGVICTDSNLVKNKWHYTFKCAKKFKSVKLIDSKQDDINTNIPKTLSKINDIIINLENTGFPFAQVMITNQTENKQTLELNYKIDSGQFYIIKKIILKSSDEFRKQTILNLIGLKEGEVYNEKKLKTLSTILSNSKLYELLRNPEILFRPNHAELYIVFKKNKSSNADGFIGFQQNTQTNALELNGNLNMSLKNGLNRAELIEFKWKSNPNKGQDLKANLVYPYLINLPLSISTALNIQKQDTTFLKNLFYGSLNYLSPFYTVGVFTQLEQSFLLSGIKPININEYKRNTVGVENKIIYLKHKKYQPILYAKIGVFNYKSDTIQDNSINNNILLELKYQQKIQLNKSFFLHNTIQFKEIKSSHHLSKNELFYFGGLNSIRGFYELELNGNSVFTAINTIEFRPVKQISLSLVYDYSQYHNTDFFQTNSIGFGFNLINPTNTLSIILANGTISGNNFNIKNTKLHLGFITNF